MKQTQLRSLRFLTGAGLLAISLVVGIVYFFASPVVNSAGLRPLTDTVFQLPISTNDIIYNPQDHLIYASRPSSVGDEGNSITRIDPFTGQIGPSVYIGSEPNKLALSDDGQTLYAAIDGAYSIRRYDIGTHTPGLQFPIGRGQSVNAQDAPYLASDIAVVPGNPNVLAVSRYLPGISPPGTGVAIFNNGVRLPNTGPGHSESANFLAFSASPGTLYGGGYDGGLRTMTVDENGVTDLTGTGTPFTVRKLKFENNLVFDSYGHVIDPVTRTLLGTCPDTNSEAFVPVTSANRVIYAVRDQSTGNVLIKAFDTTTFTQVDPPFSFPIEYDDSPKILIRYGTNGLALRTYGDRLYLIQTSLIPTGDPVPPPNITPSATPTPRVFATFVRKATLRNDDIVYSSSEHKFYVSVPSGGGDPRADTVTRVNPMNAAIENSVLVGANPDRLALSGDENTLYVGLNGDHAVRKFNVQDQTPGLQFPLGTGVNGPKIAYDMDVLPGQPNAVAISYGSQSYSYDGADIFDDGAKRVRHAADAGSMAIASVDTIYIGEYYLAKYAIDATGLTLQNRFSTSSQGESLVVGDLLYTSGGPVIDLTTANFEGTFTGVGYWSGLTVDVPNNRAFFLVNTSTGIPSWAIKAYRLDNFRPVGEIPLPDVFIYGNTPRRLIKWGENGLAFNDYNDGVYFFQSDLVSTSGIVPTAFQLSSQTYQANEGAGTLAVTIVRSGGLTETNTVYYATVDGTAIAGSDYTAMNGTLTFAPGETSKTVNIPIINDNIYEGYQNESFGLSISNATGGMVEIQEPSTASLSIVEDDNRPYVSLSNITVEEPRAGSRNAFVNAHLSNPTIEAASVNFSTSDINATAGLDYVATSGTLMFAPLETDKTIPVQILADTLYNEPNERFLVNPSNGINVTVGLYSIVTIINYNPQTAPHVGFDYDNDGKSDYSIFRPSSGAWYLQQSYAGLFGTEFGFASDRITPADYDGDSKTDIAVYRPETGIWYVVNSSTGTVSYFNFGIAEDLPTPADYDGDGRADYSVFRPSTATWYRQNSNDGSFYAIQFGASEDKPTVGDFDGDGHADVAIFRPSVGAWYQYNSSNNQVTGDEFGFGTDVITPADYDGDGKTDLAVFRPSNGFWYVRNSNGPVYTAFPFGLSDDIPATGDFDGDGKADLSVFRPSDGTWYRMNSMDGSFFAFQFGTSGDKPTQTAFRY